MRNFLGRILILVSLIVNFILLIVVVCATIFDIFTLLPSFESAFSGPNMLVNAFDLSLFLLFFVAFVRVNAWCLKNIIVAKSMKHAFIGTIVLLAIELVYFLYHFLMGGVLITNFGLYLGTYAAIFVMTIALMLGSLANFYRDCVN